MEKDKKIEAGRRATYPRVGGGLVGWAKKKKRGGGFKLPGWSELLEALGSDISEEDFLVSLRPRLGCM
jgi:hypothetical protein